MAKNITPFQKFKDIKKSPHKVQEMVEPINDMYRVSLDVDVPKSLINAYIKKVKDETNKDLRQSKSEMQLAEKLVQYVNENFLVIENLPVQMVTNVDQKAVQSQAQLQVQPQSQPQSQLQDEETTQNEGPQVQVSQPGSQGVQVQTKSQGQVGQGQVGQGQAQIAAQEIPAQEI